MISLFGCGENQTNTDLVLTDENELPTQVTLRESPTITVSQQEIKQTATIEPIQPTSTEEEPDSIEVDEGLLNVKITLPSSLLKDMTDFDPETYSEENGFMETVVNEDGSITITMSKRRHNELKAEMVADINNTLEEMIEAEDTPYIKEINASEGYRTVTVAVEKEVYEDSWDMTPLLIFFNVAFYQIFDDSEPYCEVIITDIETGEVLKSVIYPDAFDE